MIEIEFFVKTSVELNKIKAVHIATKIVVHIKKYKIGCFMQSICIVSVVCDRNFYESIFL